MKKKLKLDKKIITQLSENEQSKIKGGNAMTSSFYSCTGWTCCSTSTHGGVSCKYDCPSDLGYNCYDV